METRCDTVSGELHATFTDNSPNRSHALPRVAPPVAPPLAQPVAPPLALQPVAQPLAQPVAPPLALQPVAQPLAQPVAPPVAQPLAQPVARRWPGTVDTVAANDLPMPHRDKSRDHARAHDETTTSNTDFPTPASRQVTINPTRFVL